MEQWKDIEGYEGKYAVSNYGNVKNLANGRVKKLSTTSNGYKNIMLNSDRNQFTIHRLVAKAFLPTIEGKNHVNHKDGIKTNNHVDNLEWCTPKENVAHFLKHGLRNTPKGETHPHAKLTEEKITAIKQAFIKRNTRKQPAYNELAAQYNVHPKTISTIILGKVWQHTVK
jgi:hypothetical protein